MEKIEAKKGIVIDSLVDIIRKGCNKIQDSVTRKVKFSLTDCIMSGFAMFHLKHKSLLKFNNDSRGGPDSIENNLSALYKIANVPSDTYFREKLDVLEQNDLQHVINDVIEYIKQEDYLTQYKYLDDYYLVAIDATGTFSSNKVHCEHCCVKHHKDGKITYYHQTLVATITNPTLKTVLPIMIEPITKKDGSTKNDCEHSAAKRLLTNLKKQHNDLKMIVLLDGLYADSSIISLLNNLDIKFLITAKETDLKHLFETHNERQNTIHKHNINGIEHGFCVDENLPLNYTNKEKLVNLLKYEERKKNKLLKFSWVTDLSFANKEYADIIKIVKAGRARWKIENETFNILKNQDYNFEHNYGHGKKNLCTVLTYLMILAFLTDQILELVCGSFKKTLEKCQSRISLWEKIRGVFFDYIVNNWKQIYLIIANGLKANAEDVINTT